MEYKNDSLYSCEEEGEIIWNDSDLKIDWPINSPIISDKDNSWSKFKEVNGFYLKQ